MRIFNFEIIKKDEGANKIENIDRNSYIEKRLNKQIRWYKICSKNMKYKFCALSLITIIVNAIIPIFVLMSEEFDFKFKVIVILLSSIASISTAVLQLFKYQELWIKYRITSQLLEKEKVSYETQVKKYKKNEGTLELLIETCEDIMGRENEKWELLYDNKV